MKYRKKEALRSFFELRGMDVQIEYEIVPRYDFDAIVETLNYIIDKNEDCCFDLTGGKELVLAAMGHVSAMREVPMFQFNVRTGSLIRVKNCDCIPESDKVSMTIAENILLNGGTVVYNDKNDFCWQLTDDFKKDIEIMWDICKPNCGLWNKQCMIFDKFISFGTIDEDYSVKVSLEYMRHRNIEPMLSHSVINPLIQAGLIKNYKIEDEILTFRFKNEQVCRAICKAGNILELYAYMTAKEIADKEQGFYDDIDVGVIVDWDADDSRNTVDTRNEIDVMIMRDLVPIFVSCKNGEVHKEALYELETVAARFGGDYSKKILLTTYVSNDTMSRKHLLKRAEEMGIYVIDNVDDMSKDEFLNEFRKRVV